VASALLAAGVLAVTASCGASAPPPADADAALQALAEDSAADRSAPPDEAAATPEPLVTTEPDEFSEVGELVDGFPIDLLPVPGDAVILVTSAVPVGDADVQEVSLNLRTSATADELLELYRAALTAAGFAEVTSETSNSDLALDVTFLRSSGDEVVSIGALDIDGARTVTIGGRVRTD
jgi:hypothetical protein